MDINIFQKEIKPPTNIIISFPRDRNHIIITWDEVRKSQTDINNRPIKKIKYNIYKGMSRNGIFYQINSAPLEVNRFEDYDTTRNPNIQNWYKISTVYETENEVIEGASSEPACYQVRNTDRWFTKMNERSLWILKNTGMLFDLYTRKYEGERCTKCFDGARGRAGMQECPVCYGTGYVGGYDPAYQLYIRLKPVETSLNVSTQMFVQDNAPGAWTITDTKIMNRDILISPTGMIYQVTASMINQAGGYLFHQELKLKAYDVTDPIYNMKRTTLYPRL